MWKWILASCWFATSMTWAQSVTGTITGTVKDSTNLPVAGASVSLVQTATGSERQTPTGVRGDFVFSSVAPGEYRLAAVSPGFKRSERTGINLTAAEILRVDDVILEIGTVNEAVTVA